MGRPKGSKNAKPQAVVSAGAPAIQDAANIVTDEDMELDREIDRIANENPPPDIEQGPVMQLKKEKVVRDLLSEHVDDYKPASTVNELLEQVHLAKEMMCDSIEATPQMIKHFCRKHYPDDVGYFIYHDIKVYIPGFFEQSQKKDQRTTLDIEMKPE